MGQAKSPNMFEYNDYRRFLIDFFAWQRERKLAFSLRFLAQRAGFPSHSFFSAVVNGRRNLTPLARGKRVKGLGLTGEQADFSELLVAYNQAETERDKDRLFKELNLIRKYSNYYRLNKKHFDYFEHWYCIALREVVTLADWGDDCGKLGRLLEPPISAAEARKGVKILLNCGLIDQKSDGSYVQTRKIVSTREIPSYG